MWCFSHLNLVLRLMNGRKHSEFLETKHTFWMDWNHVRWFIHRWQEQCIEIYYLRINLHFFLARVECNRNAICWTHTKYQWMVLCWAHCMQMIHSSFWWIATFYLLGLRRILITTTTKTKGIPRAHAVAWIK